VDRRSYAWWYCPVAGAGACTNGPYAFGDVTLSATPGVTYTVQGYHSVETYYYYYDVDPGCMWGCSQWYDALGYSTGVCSPACQADPFCYCIATTGGASARTYFPPMLLYLAYVANQALGDTSKQSSTPQATLSCTPSVVTRGSNVNCTVTGPGSTRVTNWSFSGGGGNVSGPSGVSSWGGTMVQSGSISVNIASGASSQSSQITVNPRQGWATSPVAAVPGSVPECPTFVSPPPDTTAAFGCGAYLWSWQPASLSVVSGGPNDGFAYYASNYTISQSFLWAIHPDVNNPGSDFAKKQYGACGIISAASLKANVIWHESSSEPKSHYAQYLEALQLNNYGDFIEGRVATPHINRTTFHQGTGQHIDTLLDIVTSATSSEINLCRPWQDQRAGRHCADMGFMNFPPYPISCP
jgi:hypothetical protein